MNINKVKAAINDYVHMRMSDIPDSTPGFATMKRLLYSTPDEKGLSPDDFNRVKPNWGNGDLYSRFEAHGISKGPMAGQFYSLNNLLSNGVSKNRDFCSTPLIFSKEQEGAGSGLGTSYGGAYNDGLAIVLGKYRKKLSDGIGHVIINDAAADLIPDLQKAYPKVSFMKLTDAPRTLARIAANSN